MLHRSTQTIAAGVVGGAAEFILPNVGLGGGYPGGKRFNVVLRDTDIAARIERREPLFFELGHPARPAYEMLDAEVLHPHHMAAPMEVKDHDILFTAIGSPGGYGDPIERDLEAIRVDLDDGLADRQIAEDVYCAQVHFDESTKQWRVDPEGSERRPDAKRAERLARAVPVQQWWQSRRVRLLEHDLDPKLAEMYSSSMRMSEPFAAEFKEFWALPADWSPEGAAGSDGERRP